jgi:DNA-binding IclR family transcriptional regulator
MKYFANIWNLSSRRVHQCVAGRNMSDLSNPTSRVLDVITLLAAHPTEDFSLADIARQLEMSKASAHRLLVTMADADFLARNAKHKTYSLGMALLAVGQAALQKYPGLDIARSEMTKLSLELNVQCSATGVIGGDLVILAREGSPQSHESLNRVGERRPMIPPMGICHIAWGVDSVAEPYLAMAAQYMSKDSYAWLHESLELIRHRGYAVSSYGPAWRKLRQATVGAIARTRKDQHWTTIREVLGELTRNEIQLASASDVNGASIGRIVAPVFSSNGTVIFQLVLSGLPSGLTPRKLERFIERLSATAAAVTSQINGRVPAVRSGEVA